MGYRNAKIRLLLRTQPVRAGEHGSEVIFGVLPVGFEDGLLSVVLLDYIGPYLDPAVDISSLGGRWRSGSLRMPSFSVGIGDITQPELTLNEIFTYLESADKPCIVAIDEFQRVADYEQNNVEAILRSKIQMMHNTTFIFSGSERSVLAQMFGSAARPFYQCVATMSLGPIKCAEYTRFAIKLFDSYDKQLDEEAVESLYNLVQGYTYYLQRALNESFSLLPSETVCDRPFVFERIDGILTSNTDTYKELLSSLTPNQRALLTAIALAGKAMNITSVEFVKRHGLGAVSSYPIHPVMPDLVGHLPGKVPGLFGEGPKIETGPSPLNMASSGLRGCFAGEGQGYEIGPSPNDPMTFPTGRQYHSKSWLYTKILRKKAEKPEITNRKNTH